MTRIYIASDHAGFELKRGLIPYLKDELHVEVVDEGPYEYKEDDDYPDYVNVIPKRLTEEPGSLGIILGYSGQGEAISVNRCKGIRAIVYYGGERKIITLGREHNNSNVLSLGAGFLDLSQAKEAVRIWLETPFSQEERHVRRIRKIDSNDHF